MANVKLFSFLPCVLLHVQVLFFSPVSLVSFDAHGWYLLNKRGVMCRSRCDLVHILQIQWDINVFHFPGRHSLVFAVFLVHVNINLKDD